MMFPSMIAAGMTSGHGIGPWMQLAGPMTGSYDGGGAQVEPI